MKMFSTLSSEEKKLIRIMQTKNFGKARGLLITQGQPVIGEKTVLIQDIKFGKDCENGTRSETKLEDFVLSAVHEKMLHEFEILGNGEVCLEFHHGLPSRMEIKTGKENN